MKFKKALALFLAAVMLLSGCTAPEKKTEEKNVSSSEELTSPVGENTAPTEEVVTDTPEESVKTYDANIYVDGDKFMLSGKEIWLNGMNAPWQSWDDFGGSYKAQYWEEVFSMMHEDGFNSCRIWINCSGDKAIDIDENGYVSGASEKHWQDLDSLFSLAAENEIYIMATLMSFDHFKNNKKERWRAMMKDTDKIDSYINNYVIPFCKRYDDNDYVWSIDLINEPDWVFENEECGKISWECLGDYFARACAAIHENTDDMLVTIGFAMIKYNSPKYEGDYGSDEFLRSRYNNENAYVDFNSTHYYDWMATWFGCPFVVSAEEFGIDLSKPRVVGECSHEGIKALRQIKPIEECYEWAYNNGWNGVMVWTDRDLIKGEGVPQYAAARVAGQRIKELVGE